MPEVLQAPLVVEFPFTRSLGPVQSAFLSGLRERVVLGVRTGDGRVLVPPVEYDPVTAEEISDLVEVAPTGTVTTWAWNHAPRRGQPLATPFAWVLVRLDGADTPLLHALDASGPEAVHTGMRVRVRWADERSGAITDIACFEPHDGSDQREPAGHSGEFDNPVTGIVAAARLDYTYSPGRAQSAYIHALGDRRPWSASAARPAPRCTCRRGVRAPHVVSPHPNRSRWARAAR
ncbi:DNA-binding protein OS=Streptomyces alboniger OX=132473 GN=CP975_32730 PE=4 SV=1 [Streptomyces alboniger]